MTPVTVSFYFPLLSHVLKHLSAALPNTSQSQQFIQTKGVTNFAFVMLFSVKGTCHYCFVRSRAGTYWASPGFSSETFIPGINQVSLQLLHSLLVISVSKWEALPSISFSLINNALRTYYLMVKKRWDIIS